MPTQPAAMQNGQQDRTLNMPGSCMLPPDTVTASSRRASIDGADASSVPMSKKPSTH